MPRKCNFLLMWCSLTVIIAGKRDELWFVGSPPPKVPMMETECPNSHVSSCGGGAFGAYLVLDEVIRVGPQAPPCWLPGKGLKASSLPMMKSILPTYQSLLENQEQDSECCWRAKPEKNLEGDTPRGHISLLSFPRCRAQQISSIYGFSGVLCTGPSYWIPWSALTNSSNPRKVSSAYSQWVRGTAPKPTPGTSSEGRSHGTESLPCRVLAVS